MIISLTTVPFRSRQEVATAHKVAGMFGRRDPMRRYMDKIMAMIDEIGAYPRNRRAPCADGVAVGMSNGVETPGGRAVLSCSMTPITCVCMTRTRCALLQVHAISWFDVQSDAPAASQRQGRLPSDALCSAEQCGIEFGA